MVSRLESRKTFSDTGKTIDRLMGNLIELKDSFDSGTTVQAVFVSTRILEKVEKLVDMELLKKLNPARMDAFSRPECLPGTRQDILKWVINWLTTPSDEQNILWLYGLAGSGKSTISTTIAEYFRELGRLGAFMFFLTGTTVQTASLLLSSAHLPTSLLLSILLLKLQFVPRLRLFQGLTRHPYAFSLPSWSWNHLGPSQHFTHRALS